MKKLTLLIFLVIFVVDSAEAFSQNTETFFKETDGFFKSCVSNGKVDYKSIHANPENLISLMELAKSISVSTTDPKKYKAFWINAYNLSVIKGIIDNYPIKSPLDKNGFFDQTKYELGGSTLTLNDIENNKLRAQFKDARFHFVLVCGANGCPPIINEAYTPEKLEAQLQKQTTLALNRDSFIKISEGKVALSEIFKWYKKDFVKDGKTEIEFINTFRKEKIDQNAEVTYYPYDWRLNSK